MRKYIELLLIGLAFLAITTGAFFLAENLAENQWLLDSIKGLGIVGVALVGLVTGLNAFIPIPPATFAPIFIESGLSPLLVIVGFVVGTTIADSIGYVLGWLGRTYTHDNHPRLTRYLRRLFLKHEQAIPFVILGYFALAPLPNEIIMIPLALVGYPYKKLLLPLIFGNIFHHSLMVFGYAKIFSLFF